MKQDWSEALVRRGSAAWRWTGALFAAMAMAIGVGPAFAADVNALTLNIAQNPNPAIYGASATYTVTLKNQSNKTVNNAGITVTAPAGPGSFDAPSPSCVLSTGLPCAAPVRNGTTFSAAGYQLPAGATLTIWVGYYMPAAASPPPAFTLNATGTSSNNAGGPNPSAYTTVSTSYDTVFAPPPPSYPSLTTTIGHDSGNTVLWSTAGCDSSNSPDCGATYYAQYLITVRNDGAAVPSSRPFYVTLIGGAAAFTDAFGCSASCSRSGNVFTITGLGAGVSTSFTVFFKSPLEPSNIDVTATVTIDSPPVVLPAPATVSMQTIPTNDAAIQTYSSLVPTTGGSSKAKNVVDPNTGKGPFSSRVDVPTYSFVDGSPIDMVLNVTPGTIACSPSSPKCLDTKAEVTNNGTPVTFGGANAPLDGTNFLVITMVRDWTTLAKKPSSVFNATVWYTDDAGNRTVIKDCANVDLTLADRCVYQRIDMTTSAKGVITSGYLKFIIWARHNGVHSW
ncbi:MAG TPA: hypothetical protein VGI48_18435 [Caldimonas sp.]|jgi:hypothetical protein